jgi:uncharacterized protein with GYD domain
MSSYLVLIQFTEQGVQNVDQSPKRAASAIAIAKKMKMKVREMLWTIGAYDGAVVLEAPDDATVSAWALSVAKLGNVKTQTLRAFDAKEFSALVGKVV